MFYDWEQNLKKLSDEQMGKAFRAMFAYEKRGEEYDGGDPYIEMAMGFISGAIDRNAQKYEEMCERNRRNGAKGGRPRKSGGNSENPSEPEKADPDPECDRECDREADYECDYDSDPESDYERDREADSDYEAECDREAEYEADCEPASEREHGCGQDCGYECAHEPAPEPEREHGRDTDLMPLRAESPVGGVFSDAERAFREEICPHISDCISDDLHGWCDKMGQETVVDAIYEASERGKRSWGYIRGILSNWENEGRRKYYPEAPPVPGEPCIVRKVMYHGVSDEVIPPGKCGAYHWGDSFMDVDCRFPDAVCEFHTHGNVR